MTGHLKSACRNAFFKACKCQLIQEQADFSPTKRKRQQASHNRSKSTQTKQQPNDRNKQIWESFRQQHFFWESHFHFRLWQRPENCEPHHSRLSKWQNVIPHFPKSKIDRFSINLSATVTTVSDFLYLCPIWETSIYIFWDAVRPYLPPGIWLRHRYWTSVRNSSW